MSVPKHKEIRVAHLLPSTVVGGAEINTVRIADELREVNVDSTIFCLEHAEDVRKLCSRAGINTLPWRNTGPWGRQGLQYLRDSVRLAWKIRRHRFDIVHCSNLSAATGTGAVAGTLARLPVVCSVNSRNASLHSRARWCLGAVDQFVFVSEATWRALDYSVSEDRGSVIHNGLDLSRVPAPPDSRGRREILREVGVPANSTVIGMATRIAPEKNLEMLVPTLEAVLSRVPDAHLLIVGEAADDSYGSKIRQLFRKDDLSNSVTFAGYRSDALRIMSAVDIVPLTSSTEGFALVVLEAMALGKPVVATKVGGVPELIEDGTTGILCDPDDAEGMAEAIVDLVSNPDKAKQFGAAAEDRTREYFTIGDVAKELRYTYSKLAG